MGVRESRDGPNSLVRGKAALADLRPNLGGTVPVQSVPYPDFISGGHPCR